MSAELIGPLTAEEWCSLRSGAEDDFLLCCGNTSDFRDALFEVLRMGGDAGYGFLFRYAWERLVQSHDEIQHPLIDRMREYYSKPRSGE